MPEIWFRLKHYDKLMHKLACLDTRATDSRLIKTMEMSSSDMVYNNSNFIDIKQVLTTLYADQLGQSRAFTAPSVTASEEKRESESSCVPLRRKQNHMPPAGQDSMCTIKISDGEQTSDLIKVRSDQIITCQRFSPYMFAFKTGKLNFCMISPLKERK